MAMPWQALWQEIEIEMNDNRHVITLSIEVNEGTPVMTQKSK